MWMLFLLPSIFAALAGMIWAAVLDYPLMGGIWFGLAIGLIIGCRYYKAAMTARRARNGFKETITITSTSLTLLLFLSLASAMGTWLAKELL